MISDLSTVVIVAFFAGTFFGAGALFLWALFGDD